VGVQALNLLRQTLWQMSSNPGGQIETSEEIRGYPTESFFDA
jgi:hypothetical protein